MATHFKNRVFFIENIDFGPFLSITSLIRVGEIVLILPQFLVGVFQMS